MKTLILLTLVASAILGSCHEEPSESNDEGDDPPVAASTPVPDGGGASPQPTPPMADPNEVPDGPSPAPDTVPDPEWDAWIESDPNRLITELQGIADPSRAEFVYLTLAQLTVGEVVGQTQLDQLAEIAQASRGDWAPDFAVAVDSAVVLSLAEAPELLEAVPLDLLRTPADELLLPPGLEFDDSLLVPPGPGS